MKMGKSTKQKIDEILSFIESLAIDCSQHLQDQHNQTNPNDKPRFYFDNIAKQAQELRKEV